MDITVELFEREDGKKFKLVITQSMIFSDKEEAMKLANMLTKDASKVMELMQNKDKGKIFDFTKRGEQH